jgi:ligand-binding sensor domain-containing protein/signal transduction histidine kinase
LLWLGLSLLLYSSLLGQSAELAYRNYTINEGLPSSECYEIIQDSEDYIWISTDNGVSKFDGDHFTNYGPEEGLMDKTVLFLHEDHRGWIWMSTLSGNCYIYRADTIAAYEYNHYLVNKRKDYSLVHDFIIDTSGNLHFSLSDHSIFQINENGDTSSWSKTRFGYEIGFYKREGKMLQLTQRNYHLPVNKQTQTIGINDPDFPNIADLEVRYVSMTRQTSKLDSYVFLVGESIIYQHLRKLYLYNNKYQLQREVKFDRGAINCISQLKDGRIIIGFFDSRGLLVFDDIKSIFNGDAGRAYFNGNTISHICEGKDKSIWVSTVDNGIYHIPSLDVSVYHFNLGKARFVEAQSNTKDKIFLGVANGRIFTLDTSTGWKEYKNQELYGLDHLRYFDQEQVLLANSPLQYLYTQEEENWKKVSSQVNIIFTNYVDNLAKEIIGFDKMSLFYLHMADKAASRLSLKERKNYRLGAATSMAQTNPDSIWVGKRGGLFLLKDDTNLQKVSGFADIPNISVRCLKVYQDSSLLVGTKNHGMLRLKNGMLSQVAMEQGLLDNTIDRIRVDPKGQIWVSSKQGLNRLTYQGDSLYVNTISSLNGLPSNEVVDVTFSEDKIWVVGKQWVTTFPADYKFDYDPLKVKIAKVKLDGEEHPLSSAITLDWNNSISLHFTAFNYHAFKNQAYRYRLQPTEDWLHTNQPVVNFSNLSPDKYQFEIQTQQNDGTWSAATSLSLQVLPPYWQRWWFISLIVLLAAYIAYYLFNQRILKLKQERKQIELEDQINQFKQKAYQAQMNPHFVFNCLNAIQGFIIGGEQDQKKATRFLVRFSDLMRQALDAYRKESISLSDEIKLLDNYLSLEQMRFDHKFEYFIQLDATLESDWIQIPPLLIQPYVENAVLHGVASLKDKGIIRLDYRMLDKKTLEVTISDNGPGISYTKSIKQQAGKIKRESVGMSITQKRLEIISLRSDNIEITEPIDDYGSVSGTLVKVQIPLNKEIEMTSH